MKTIVVIPARGGSKRIPKKNIKDFLGKPIISYVIETAIKSQLFDEVMVSTDSEEIAEIARKCGAKVPFLRSAELADAFTTSDKVLLDVLDQYEKAGRSFDTLVCMYPTSPFVKVADLKNAMTIMEEKRPAEIKMVAPFSFPPQRGLVIDENGCVGYKYPEYANTRSQDLEPIYHDVGQLYVYDVAKFRASNGCILDGVVPIIVDEQYVQDIDNESDWQMAELKYRILNKMD